MTTLVSISSHSYEAPPPLVRLPLIISESLRSAISSDASSTQGIVSILLSAADFEKLDLSKLQLFSVDGLVMEPAASMASSEVPSSQAQVKILPDDDFSFQTPLILSPVADLPLGAVAFPVLKSKGVVEAEKASAEHHLLKLGAVSPSPRARKKAVSMDEISLNENLGSLDIGVSGNVAEESNGRVDIAGARVRARKQLPELEPLPGLEQRAEALKKKHFERVLSRTLSEVRSEQAKIDLKASPAAKFLLQVMPWELTPPITPVTAPAAIPFIWEDVPGRPKPRALPSPCPTLPLPPRLLPGPPQSSSSPSSAVLAAGTWACPSSDTSEFLPHVDGKQSSPAKRNPHPRHGRTHRKNTHSWHVLHNLFSGGYQQYPSHAADALLEAPKDLSVAGGETSRDGVSSGSTSFSLSLSTTTAPEDVLSSRESSLGARYELPPIYVAPVVPLTPPHRGLGPLEDACGKQTNRLSYLARLFRLEKRQVSNISRTGSLFNLSKKHVKVTSESYSYLLDDANGGQTRSRIAYGAHTDECSTKAYLEATSDTRKQSVSAQLSPVAASLYQSPKPSGLRIQIGSGRMKVFLKLRRRGARVIVASYRAVKRALFLRRVSQSKHFNHTQLPYHTLHR